MVMRGDPKILSLSLNHPKSGTLPAEQRLQSASMSERDFVMWQQLLAVARRASKTGGVLRADPLETGAQIFLQNKLRNFYEPLLSMKVAVNHSCMTARMGVPSARFHVIGTEVQ